uniref:Uncharacterized protein n=1 Tax=Rhizophora mucronata TaxID=61149 RepID=A0A2P2LQQ1_RHIMU
MAALFFFAATIKDDQNFQKVFSRALCISEAT